MTGRRETMRAVVIARPGGPEVLELREVPVPSPGPGEVLVRVRAAGLNRPDVIQRKGHYPAPPGSPADIPGLEYAGEIAAPGPPGGPGAGDAAPRAWTAGACVMGLVGGGACAEYLVAHADTVLPVPPLPELPGAAAGPASDPLVRAAAIPEVFLTAYDALALQLAMRAGETALIHAVTSGVGTAAVQLARAWGVRTIGTSRSAEKLRRVTPLGLDVAVDTSREDFVEVVRRETGDRGVDLVLDLVGAPALEGNLRALALRGRMILVGFLAGRSATVDLSLVQRKRLTVVGTAMRSRGLDERSALARAFERDVLPRFASGLLRPVLERVFPMADVAEAHRAMEASAHVGKFVLAW